MNFAMTAVACLVGALLFEKLHVPAGALVGGMVGVVVVRLAMGVIADLPRPTHFLLYAMIGWIIGQSVDRDVLATLRPVAIPMAVAIGALLLVAGLVSVALVQFGVTDSKTAFLAASPGGLTQMSALGTAVGANVPIILAVHMLRVASVVVITPIVVRSLPLS